MQELVSTLNVLIFFLRRMRYDIHCLLLLFYFLKGFVLIQIALGNALGFDPLTTSIPVTLGLLLADQIGLKGSIAESVYQRLFPDYKRKIIAHEAGHFLVAYLLGLPLRGCIVNAWDARKLGDIKGQAGTIFFVSIPDI
jgi:hypothetical protein